MILRSAVKITYRYTPIHTQNTSTLTHYTLPWYYTQLYCTCNIFVCCVRITRGYTDKVSSVNSQTIFIFIGGIGVTRYRDLTIPTHANYSFHKKGRQQHQQSYQRRLSIYFYEDLPKDVFIITIFFISHLTAWFILLYGTRNKKRTYI